MTSRSRSGFTLVELAIVISVMALVAPGVFLLHRTMSRGHHRALARAESAAAARSISEELRRDLLTRTFIDNDPLTLSGDKKCGEVVYVLRERVLIREVRDDCGTTRALATDIDSLERTPWGIRINFAYVTGRGEPFTMAVDVGLPGGRP